MEASAIVRRVTFKYIFFVHILPEDGHRSGPKHVVVVHKKSSTNKYLLRTVVLIKVLVYVFMLSRVTDQNRRLGLKLDLLEPYGQQ
jgi:hypothetical protein